MHKSWDSLLFNLADIFHTTLYEVDQTIRGVSTKTFEIADLWKVKSDVTICVDEQNKDMVTAYVRIKKNLWAYAVITSKGQWLLMFDGNRAKIGVGAEKHFGLGNAKQTLTKLRPAITAAFSLENKKQWVGIEHTQLLDGLA